MGVVLCCGAWVRCEDQEVAYVGINNFVSTKIYP